ncbi:MAG: hypothetical protein MK074_05275 [Phycisphaerales bacterium]|nr:hypothetical protein [Phycisphaerales bacterium]
MARSWKWWARGKAGAGRSPGRRQAARQVEVRIGLDVGTATTACVVNVLGQQPFDDAMQAIALDAHSVTMPSSFAIDGDTFVIGHRAEAMASAHRSVLMWLPMLAGERVETASSGKYDGLKQTVFNLGDHMISAKEVMVLFLERVLGRMVTELDAAFGRGGWYGTMHIACPAHSGQAYRDLLKDIAALAFDLAMAGASGDGPWRAPSMTASLSGLTERYQRGCGRSCDGVLDIDIVPASQAAAAAVVASGRTDDGRLAIIDLGAGSTNATVCTVNKRGVRILADGGVWHGMDDVDQLLATSRAVRRRPPRDFRREQGLRPSDRPMVRRGLDRMVGVLPGLLQRITSRSGTDGWVSRRRAAFDIVLIGGGSCCELLVDEFKRREQSPMPTVVSFWDVDVFTPVRGGGLPLLGVTDRRRRHVAPDDHALCVLACGLADRSVSVSMPAPRKSSQPVDDVVETPVEPTVDTPTFTSPF